MIQESKKLRFELDILKEKMNAQNDPVFTAPNEKTMIILEEGEEAPAPEKTPKVNPSINNGDVEMDATENTMLAAEKKYPEI
jgi:hypothetical protein